MVRKIAGKPVNQAERSRIARMRSRPKLPALSGKDHEIDRKRGDLGEVGEPCTGESNVPLLLRTGKKPTEKKREAPRKGEGGDGRGLGDYSDWRLVVVRRDFYGRKSNLGRAGRRNLATTGGRDRANSKVDEIY